MDLLARLHARTGALAGWRRRGAAVALGALSALAFAPVHAVPLMVPALVGLWWLVQSSPTRRRAFAIAWFWSVGHFAAGNFWIANSFLLDIARFGWMVPPVIGGLASYLALYPALAAALAWRRDDLSPARIAAFSALWTGAEWLRGHVLTGYPWNLAAYVWDGSGTMMQSAALWGSWGLSLVTVLALTLPAAAADPAPPRRRRVALGLSVLILSILWAGGALRLAGATSGHVPDVRIRIVQANVSQAEKLQGGFARRHFERYVSLTRDTPGWESVTHVVWPESAANFLLDREPALRRIIAGVVPPGGALLAGTVRGAPAAGPLEQVWNSLVVIGPDGEIRATADKAHLVPLGEYVPLRGLFPFINKLTPGSMDFSAAPGPVTVAVPGAPPAGPSICYEVIFPLAIVDPAARPGWLVNITNDGWFGNSPGPYQHFVSARFRSVEEGIPMVRAANTGISGVIDGYGRVETRSLLGTEAVIDADLPVVLAPTPFARLGAAIPLLLGLCALAPLARRRWLQGRTGSGRRAR